MTDHPSDEQAPGWKKGPWIRRNKLDFSYIASLVFVIIICTFQASMVVLLFGILFLPSVQMLLSGEQP